MADGFSYQVTGLADITRRMAELGDRTQRNVVRRAGWAGVAVFRAEARLLAPLWHGEVSQGHPPPGTLKRSIVATYAPEASRPDLFVTKLVVRHGKRYQAQGKGGQLSQDAYYWWWVEFGNAHIAATPYMVPAYESKKHDAADAVGYSMRQGITSELAALT